MWPICPACYIFVKLRKYRPLYVEANMSNVLGDREDVNSDVRLKLKKKKL